jgi:hypothetical protein
MRLNGDKQDKTRPPLSAAPTPPSGDAARVFCTFGLVVSCRYADQEPIVTAISEIGGKVIYRVPSTGHLFILRAYQIEKALRGDVSELQEIYDRKMKGEKGD